MMRHRLDQAVLLVRTTTNLRLSQVLHRARLRAQRFPPSRPIASSVIGLLPLVSRPGVGWPGGFVPLDVRFGEGFPGPEANARGCFRFLNETLDLGHPPVWDPPGSGSTT